jgi:hypothetical protein
LVLQYKKSLLLFGKSSANKITKFYPYSFDQVSGFHNLLLAYWYHCHLISRASHCRGLRAQDSGIDHLSFDNSEVRIQGRSNLGGYECLPEDL